MRKSAVATDQVAPDFTDEGELLARLTAGCDVAFRHLVRTYGPRMLVTARRLLRDPEAAQDALQDAFLSVHEKISGFERRSSLAGWLHRVVTNAALMRLRVRRRKQECSLEDALPQFDDLGYLIGPCTMTEEPVQKLMQRREVRELVRRAIDELPERHRTVLLLRDIEGFDTAEVAAFLDVSVGATKVRLHRARLALKKTIEPVLQGELP